MGPRTWIALIAGLVALVAVWSLHAADETWRGQDFNALATRVIGAELPPGKRAGLAARTLHTPSGTQDRFVCVQPAAPDAGEVYEVQFRKGMIGIKTNEI